VLATSNYGHDDATRMTSITNKNASAATLSYYNYGVFADPEVQRRADPKMQRSQPPFRYAQGCS
jgi:hypothetical protein